MSTPAFNVQFFVGCLQVYPFRRPFPKAATTFADYRSSFRTYMSSSNDTKILINNLMSARLAFLQVSIPGTLVPSQGQITAVEQYLELLYTLHESLQAAVTAQQTIICDKDLVFEWSMYLSDNAENKEFRSGSLLFEIIMMTQLKALLHIQIARELLNNDVLTFCSEAGKQLLQAAALFDLLANRLDKNQQWSRRFHPKLPNPAETSPAVMAGLAKYLRGRAQSCAAVKAFNERKASSLLIARLFTGAANLHARALTSLVNNNAGLRQSLIMSIGSDRELLTSISLFQFAATCADSSGKTDPQLGQALTCINMARRHLVEQRSESYEWSLSGFPKSMNDLGPALALVSSSAKQLSENMSMFAADWDRDNRLIFFQGLPSSIEEFTIPMPTEAIVANLPVASEPGNVVAVPFVDPPKSKGMFGAVMSVFRSPSTAAALAPPAPDSGGIAASIEGGGGEGGGGSGAMTEEQFAQELRRRMNLASGSPGTI